MPGSEASERELRERLTAILRATPPLMRVLSVARHLRLADWFVFSGAVYQPVLNHLTGRPLNYGVKDYDLANFDASDLPYEAEDAVIRRVKAAFDEPLRSIVEVRNQARVHLWFGAKFGEAYTPLSCTTEALEHFASAIFAVGVRLEPDGGTRTDSAGTAALDGTGDVIRAKAAVDFDHVDVARLRAAPHRFGGAGAIGGHSDIITSGNSVAQMLGNGDEGLRLLIIRGDLSALLVDLSGLEFGNALLSALGMPKRTPVECMIADFSLQKGLPTSIFPSWSAVSDEIRACKPVLAAAMARGATSPHAGRVSGTGGRANRGARTHVSGAIRARAKPAGPDGAWAGVALRIRLVH